MNKLLSGIVLLLFALAMSVGSCNKRNFLNTGGTLRFSTDTLTFDTLFTTIASVTKEIKIYNQNNQWIRLSTIGLKKGNSSAYRLNIDGKPTIIAKDIDIAPRDSAYIFVALTIDPTNGNNPFLIEDSLIADLNGKQFGVHLMAYGQDAIYVNDSILSGNLTWTKTRPYVVINSCLVESGSSLTIEPGTRVYMHANSKFFVNGTLKANGTKTDSIVFQGDRLDRDYFGGDIAGEWCGLHFLTDSKANELSYCIIKNGGAPWKVYNPQAVDYDYLTGALIYLQPNDTGSTATKLVMRNCFLGLSIAHGILAFNSSLSADNCLIYTCGAQNFYALEGGKYNFNYCTMANYGHRFLKHDKEPILALRNYIPNKDITKITGNALVANFTNCIVYGSATEGNELFLDNYNVFPYSVNFFHCILKQNETIKPNEANIDASTLSLLNKDPKFKDPYKLNFTLDAASSAFLKAQPLAGIPNDIIDKARGALPTIGCYE